VAKTKKKKRARRKEVRRQLQSAERVLDWKRKAILWRSLIRYSRSGMPLTATGATENPEKRRDPDTREHLLAPWLIQTGTVCSA
jgi:hypothetical protein